MFQHIENREIQEEDMIQVGEELGPKAGQLRKIKNTIFSIQCSFKVSFLSVKKNVF